MSPLSVSRGRIGLAVSVALGLLVGCEGSASPTSPGAPSANARATMQIWRVSFSPIPGDQTHYAVRFRASETTGLSGLVIKAVHVETPFGGDAFTDACWGRTIRIEPGSTQDAFDDGWADLGTCAPRALPVTGISVRVLYVDDSGTNGTASAPVPTQ